VGNREKPLDPNLLLEYFTVRLPTAWTAMVTKSKPADQLDPFSGAKHQSLSPLTGRHQKSSKIPKQHVRPDFYPKNLPVHCNRFPMTISDGSLRPFSISKKDVAETSAPQKRNQKTSGGKQVYEM